MKNAKLAKTLLDMAEADSFMRNKAIDDAAAWDSSLDKKHTAALKRIVQQHGWPTISLVGKKASRAAWLLAQHADHDTGFQQACLKLMKAVPEDEVARSDIAYLEDRVLVAKGQPQLYGTQFFDDGRGLQSRPIINRRNLAKRRKSMGLTSFASYVKEHNKLYGNGNKTNTPTSWAT